MITIKLNLDICMAKAGIRSYSELAGKAGISRPTLNRYKKDAAGYENITIGAAKSICEVLNCKLEDLIEFQYE